MILSLCVVAWMLQPGQVKLPVHGQLIGIQPGEDWSLPLGTEAVVHSGFFSEDAYPSFQVPIRSIDVSWRQLNPSPGVFATNLTGSAQGMNFDSLDDQLALSGPYWMRLWASGVDWAPSWIISECGITETWEDYDNQFHLPIWNTCVWNHLMACYRHMFQQLNLRADPDLILMYVPGAFTWCEFDYEIIDQAASSGLEFATFNTWFQGAMAEMVSIFNGENSDPNDDFASKLVFTGEDFPWGPWDGQANLLARDAVVHGTGIRSGITELFNFHLNHTPAYGATIAQDGHILTDEDWPLLMGDRIIAAENECFNDCGYSTTDHWYAVKMANLKALQLRVNYLYVVPSDSYMGEFPEHWEWVRMSLGQKPQTAPDAWVAMREFQDIYWVDEDSHTWPERPWIHNFERWLVQRDLPPNGQTQRGTDVRVDVLEPDNGISYEGRRTNQAQGQDRIYFFVDDRFMAGENDQSQIKVTYLDSGTGTWHLEFMTAQGLSQSESILNTNSGLLKTATFELENPLFSNGMDQGADFTIVVLGSDIEVRFVRLIRGPESLDYSSWPTPNSILFFIGMLQ